MLDITGPLRAVGHLSCVANDCLERLEGLVQSDAPAAGNIKDFSCHLFGRRSAGQQVGGNYVIDRGKIAALFAIAVNRWLLAAKHGSNELGHDSGILRSRVLARSKNVEVTQRNRGQSVDAVEALHIKLA